MKLIWNNFYILVLLNILDFAITGLYVTQVGPFGELNPFLRLAVLSTGIWSILLIKFVFLSLLGFSIYKRSTQLDPPITPLLVSLIVLNSIFVCVVGWGLICLLTLT